MILTLDPGHRIQYSHFSPLTGQPDMPENYHIVTIELSGKGKPLFKDIKDRINLKLLETRKFNSGSVGLSYRSDTKEVIKA